MCDILQLLNENTKAEQSKRRMAELQTKLVGWDQNVTLNNERRKLVDEDTWTYADDVKEKSKKNRALQVSERKMQSVHVFIFSDCIVVAKPLVGYHAGDGFFKLSFLINLVGAVLSTQKNTEGGFMTLLLC